MTGGGAVNPREKPLVIELTVFYPFILFPRQDFPVMFAHKWLGILLTESEGITLHCNYSMADILFSRNDVS